MDETSTKTGNRDTENINDPRKALDLTSLGESTVKVVCWRVGSLSSFGSNNKFQTGLVLMQVLLIIEGSVCVLNILGTLKVLDKKP